MNVENRTLLHLDIVTVQYPCLDNGIKLNTSKTKANSFTRKTKIEGSKFESRLGQEFSSRRCWCSVYALGRPQTFKHLTFPLAQRLVLQPCVLLRKISVLKRVFFPLTEGKAIPVNRPWRPIGLRDVEAITFSRQSANRFQWGCQPYRQAALYLPGRFLVVISVRGWVDPRQEGLGKLKIQLPPQESNPLPSGS
jgi:hypothetical protein